MLIITIDIYLDRNVELIRRCKSHDGVVMGGCRCEYDIVNAHYLETTTKST